jgi:hypothetical protein
MSQAAQVTTLIARRRILVQQADQLYEEGRVVESERADAAAKLIAEQLCAMGSHKNFDGRCVRCGAWEQA